MPRPKRARPAASTAPPSAVAASAVPPTAVSTKWMVVLEHFYDDYKRPEGWAKFVGVFDTKRAAKIAGVTAAFRENSGHADYGSVDDEAASHDEYDQKWKVYIDVARSVVNVDFNDAAASDAFDQQHREAMECCLGESEYGVKSSGDRPAWKEVVVRGDADAVAAHTRLWAQYDDTGVKYEPMQKLKLFELE